MKIVIGYPLLESGKGIPLLGQNRQFQWAHSPWTAYPIVPASAATLLSRAGHQVYWFDGINKGWSLDKWTLEVKKLQPDIIMLETKTPVIKQHWKIINKLKLITHYSLLITLVGDHVTALPEESFKNSQVDYILTGGDYDFLLLNLVNHLTKGEKLEPGIYWKEKIRNSKFEIRNSGKFILNHDLNKLPFIDRELTKWKLYAFNNSNYLKIPGTYTMFARDCWWGRCSFCVTGDTQILTKSGNKSIKEIVENEGKCEVLTHQGRYRLVTAFHKRKINENVIKISSLYIPSELSITPNHQVYYLSKRKLKHCSRRGGWTYLCKPDRISQFLNCQDCSRKYYHKYEISSIYADNLKKGDFLAIPINKKMKDIKFLNLKEVLDRNPTIMKTDKRISEKLINDIFLLDEKQQSQRAISRELKIDRETINRYLTLRKENSLTELINPFNITDEGISFKYGTHKVPFRISIDEGFLFLAGLYIAEGHVSYCKNRPNSAVIGWTFNKKEKDLINKTKLFFKKKFNVSLNDTLNLKNNTRQLYLGATVVAKFFEILFGVDSYCKKIPEDFLYLPIEKQRSLLLGLFSGDGHFRQRERVGDEYIFETVSQKLTEQVFLILLRFNVIPSFKIIKPRFINEAIKYKITLFRKDIFKVFPHIKFDIEKVTYKRGFVLKDYAFIPIEKIKKEPFNGFVYNLTVDEDHSYVANFLAIKNCSWTTIYPGKYCRTISVEKALSEIGELTEKYHIKEIMDDSGTFPVGNWLREFCQGMIKRGYHKKIKIDCNMRFNSELNLEDFKLMKKAGFRLLLFGLESINQQTLNKINKNLKSEQIQKTLELVKKAHLYPHITVMVGYPWETKKDINNTLRFTKSLFSKGLIDSLQATMVMPYPGTPLFKEALEKKWLKTLDWAKYDMKESVLKTELSEDELKDMVKKFYNSIFIPKFIIKKAQEALTDFDTLKYYIRLGLKFPSKLLDFKNKT